MFTIFNDNSSLSSCKIDDNDYELNEDDYSRLYFTNNCKEDQERKADSLDNESPKI